MNTEENKDPCSRACEIYGLQRKHKKPVGSFCNKDACLCFLGAAGPCLMHKKRFTPLQRQYGQSEFSSARSQVKKLNYS